MFRTFMAIGEDECRIEEKINSEINEFLKKNPCLKELHRSAPSVSLSPVGSYNSGYMISIAVTSEFKEMLETAFK